MTSPDMLLVDEVAEQLGVPVGVVIGACGALGLNVTDGVHHSYVESIRQVVLQWIREGKI